MARTMILLLMTVSNCIYGQTKALFENLPVGKYDVGFKIITLTDSTRVSKPRYNYFGEKETGDIHQTIRIHVWYPAKPNSGKGKLTYGEYCYSHFLGSVNEMFEPEKRTNAFNSARETFQGFFGAVTDDDWRKVLQATFLAQKDADHVPQKFPLLIGMLRPLSTNITNEVLASNGYVIAMVVSTSGRLPAGYISDVRDMQHAMAYLIQSGIADAETIGTYGFSGSGFSQVLLAMSDPRIMALADIESALYGEGIWDIFSSSDLYNAANLRIPFLHIYGKELGKSDTHFEKFHEKKYEHRYHLVLNYSRLHHWDLATEGRSSTTVVHVRGDKEPGVKASFELANHYLFHFFEATLKKSAPSKAMLNCTVASRSYNDSLWTFKQYPALPYPPNRFQRTRRSSAARLQRLRKSYSYFTIASHSISTG